MRLILFLAVFTSFLSAASVTWRGAPVQLNFDLAGQRVPNWSGGTLMILEGDDSSTPSFRLLDKEGQLITVVPLIIPDAALISVQGFARGADGAIAACGTVIDAADHRAPFLAILKGDKTLVVRTAPYIPHQLAVANDGTVWTEGVEIRELGANEPTRKTMPVNSKAAVIRRFSASGKVIGSFIPHSEMGDPISLSRVNYLGAAQDRIGWYCENERRYVEFMSDGSVHDTRDIAMPSGATTVTGMAITSSGDALLSVDMTGRSAVCLIDVAARSCDVVQNGLELGYLYGADGDTVMSAGTARYSINSFKIAK